jgi:hypothetical protein
MGNMAMAMVSEGQGREKCAQSYDFNSATSEGPLGKTKSMGAIEFIDWLEKPA